MTLKIGNGAGFLGDDPDAPRRLVETADLDFLTLEYLAELTLSILASQREKDPAAGFARDFLPVLESLLPSLAAGPRLHIVTNAGGVNHISCARATARVLDQHGLGATNIGVVTGDDMLPELARLQSAGCRFENLDTGQPLEELDREVVSTHAYVGARPIADALAGGARIVITGRVADASLTVGPAAQRFAWRWDDWDVLAGASVAGHLIECGAQATGGLYSHWREFDLAGVGYPIAELEANGSATIAKPPGSTGRVSRETVVEQLLYEIGDPAHYLTPDVDVDFTTVELEETATDRVVVRGATGRPAPSSLKVSLAYRDGYMASGQLLAYGDDCLDKAEACGQIVLARLEAAGLRPARYNVECLGAGHAAGTARQPPSGLGEVVVRFSAADPRRESIEAFARQLAPLITSGPPGLAGYAAGRPQVRPVLAYWPTLVPRELVPPRVEVRAAREWL